MQDGSYLKISLSFQDPMEFDTIKASFEDLSNPFRAFLCSTLRILLGYKWGQTDIFKICTSLDFVELLNLNMEG